MYYCGFWRFSREMLVLRVVRDSPLFISSSAMEHGRSWQCAVSASLILSRYYLNVPSNFKAVLSAMAIHSFLVKVSAAVLFPCVLRHFILLTLRWHCGAQMAHHVNIYPSTLSQAQQGFFLTLWFRPAALFSICSGWGLPRPQEMILNWLLVCKLTLGPTVVTLG